MEYRFEHTYTRRDMEMLSRLSAKTRQKWKVLLVRGIPIVIGVAYGVLCAVWWGNMPMTALCMVACILFLWIGVFYHKRTAILTWRKFAKDHDVSITVLEEDRIYGKGKLGESVWPYDSITALYHYKDSYCLMVGKSQVIMLPESDLCQGDLASFPAFLEERTGKTITELK